MCRCQDAGSRAGHRPWHTYKHRENAFPWGFLQCGGGCGGAVLTLVPIARASCSFPKGQEIVTLCFSFSQSSGLWGCIDGLVFMDRPFLRERDALSRRKTLKPPPGPPPAHAACVCRMPPPHGPQLQQSQGKQTPLASDILLQITWDFFLNQYKNRLWNRLSSGSPSGLECKKLDTGITGPSLQTIIYPLEKAVCKTPSPCSPHLCPVTDAKQKTSHAFHLLTTPVPGLLGTVPQVPAAKHNSLAHMAPACSGQRSTRLLARHGSSVPPSRAHRCGRSASSFSPVKKKNKIGGLFAFGVFLFVCLFLTGCFSFLFLLFYFFPPPFSGTEPGIGWGWLSAPADTHMAPTGSCRGSQCSNWPPLPTLGSSRHLCVGS